MQKLSVPRDQNVIVGIGTGDDAGVYRISESAALIQTVDYITPIVDDPFTFGRIAACNSLSDVYAMGGRPLTALNIVCFPTGKFTFDILGEILKGGLAAIEEAGAFLLGGHSVDDPELKYGLSVTGIVHPGRVMRNDTPRVGDALVLTKPLGTGIIATAVKAGSADDGAVAAFERSMSSLNRTASELMAAYGAHACTDITGFGLIGHAREMLGRNAFELIIDAASVPVLPGAREAAAAGFIPGGMYRNRDFVGDRCSFAPAVSQVMRDIMFDPQTSGGLLIALEEGAAAAMVGGLRAAGVADAAVIGLVRGSGKQGIVVQ
jgi:selenide, water dikinase